MAERGSGRAPFPWRRWTLPYAGEAPAMPERYRGRVAIDPERCREAEPGAEAGPVRKRGGEWSVDAGACLFSPEEAAMSPGAAVSFTGDPRMASSTREGLLVRDRELALAEALQGETRRLFRRSLRLRAVTAGSCAGCEVELAATTNVVFDLARFGIDFVASPRHADGIIVTGIVNRNMQAALRATYDAVPDPRLVIAMGACAIGGGPFQGSPEIAGGLGDEIPVDLYIPGCPPHPITILDGLLRMLGRLK